MKLEEKVRAVESLFKTLSEELDVFQAQAGFSCALGCGKCCEKPGIPASPLEFTLGISIFLRRKSRRNAGIFKQKYS